MYNIQFLRNKEFDSLPESETKGSRIDDSLGFYNPDKKKIYIRWTESDALNKYLLNHEFDHILEEQATDEDENGIRHKKFFKEFFLPAVTAGIYSGGETGALYNAGASDDNKFQLFGGLGGLGVESPDKKERINEGVQANQAMQHQQQMNDMFSLFSSAAGSQGSGMGGGQSAGYSTYGGSQDSGQGSLNIGMNQTNSDNPFASDQQRFKYGAPAGRLAGF